MLIPTVLIQETAKLLLLRAIVVHCCVLRTTPSGRCGGEVQKNNKRNFFYGSFLFPGFTKSKRKQEKLSSLHFYFLLCLILFLLIH